jgi:broad specificity phosphatase PhoE
MTTVYFLRHGPSQENGEGRVQGQQPGTLLIPDTERYLTALVPLLRTKDFTMLLSSDLQRAVTTREILKKFLLKPDIKEGVSPLLREKAMGYYEGMLWKDVPPAFQEQRGKVDYDFRSFGGENDTDVKDRVRYALRELALRYPNAHICCVTHAGWLKQLVQIADTAGVIPDQWSNRSAIYEVGLGPLGQLRYLRSMNIEAQVVAEEE